MKNHIMLNNIANIQRFRSRFLVYLPLLCVFVTAVFASTSSAQSYDVTATVPPPPPKIAAVITSLSNFQRFSTPIAPIKGVCAYDVTDVIVQRNDVVVTTVPCSDGSFTADVELVNGLNKIEANVLNGGGQGPASNPVFIYYDAPTASESLGSSSNIKTLATLPFGINSDSMQAHPKTSPQIQIDDPIKVATNAQSPYWILASVIILGMLISFYRIRQVRLEALEEKLIDEEDDQDDEQ